MLAVVDGIERPSVGIHFPDDADPGAGTFTIELTPRALLSPHPIAAMLANLPFFQISATINPSRNIPVRLAQADGSTPRHRVVFRLPHGLDLRVAQTLTVEFSAWRIVGAAMGGQALSARSDLESH